MPLKLGNYIMETFLWVEEYRPKKDVTHVYSTTDSKKERHFLRVC